MLVTKNMRNCNKYFMGIQSLLSAIIITNMLHIEYESLWPMLIWCVEYLLFAHCNQVEKNERKIRVSILVSGILGVFTVLGNTQYWADSKYWYMKICAGIFGIGFLLYHLISKIFSYIENQGALRFKDDELLFLNKKNKSFGIIYITLLLTWIPYYLWDYPGVLTSGTTDQMLQGLGYSDIVNHHPIIHTLLIHKWLHNFFGIFISEEIHIYGMITLLQLLVVLFTMTVAITLIKAMFPKTKLWIIAFAFYALEPFHAISATMLVKDIWFSIFVIFLIIIMYFLMRIRTCSKWIYIILIFTGIGCCLFRTNGYYAFILTTIVLSYGLFALKQKGVVVSLLLVISISMIIRGPIYDNLSKNKGSDDIIESLSIPAQQIAFTIASDGEITETQYDLLNEVIDVNLVSEKYTAWWSDPIKNLVREKGNQQFIKENATQFWGVWINIGLNNPKLYLQAWVNQTYGYWYPDTDYIVRRQYVHENEMGVVAMPLLPETFQVLLEDICIFLEKSPILGALWCPGFYTWILIVMCGYSIYKKHYAALFSYMILFGVFITLCIAAPLHSDFRYWYSAVIACPLVVALSLFENADDNYQECLMVRREIYANKK